MNVTDLSHARVAPVSPRPAEAAPQSAEPVDVYSDPRGSSQLLNPKPLTPEQRQAYTGLAPSAFPHQTFTTSSDGKTHAVTFTYDADGRTNISNLTLVGSWDNKTGHYTTDWGNSSVPMTRDKDGAWHATIQVVDDSPHDWQWGVKADSPTGQQQWAVFEEGNLKFQPQGPAPFYAPTQMNRMGMTHTGGDIGFKYWAPDAQNVSVRVWGKDAHQQEEIPMTRDAQTGTWAVDVPGGWQALKGKVYAYDVTTAEGTHVLRSDPYGRELQGQQRGIAQVYLAARTGQEVTPYYVDSQQQSQGKPSWDQLIRFEVEGHSNAKDVVLTLSDDSGHVLTKDELLKRLGSFDDSLVSNYHQGKFNDFYGQHIDSAGRIHLVQQGGAWGALVNNPQALAGLHYHFDIPGQDASAVNDPWSDVISPNYGWNRYNVIDDFHFNWKNDNAPRMATAPDKMVIYQLHVGSFMGDSQNVHRSTFDDVTKRLQYLKDTGVNTLELLPVNSFEGSRDWGYIGTSTMAVSEQYGFEDKDGRWVDGREALCRLIDAAHGMGFNVYNDVVYNHFGGNYNDMWNSDGQANPYFNWGTDSKSPALVGTPWGDMPSYDKHQVRQFAVDSVMQNLDELHFDDLRFDFTNPIHDDSGGGGEKGWTLLRKINREVHFFHPSDMTNAEEFPNAPIITQPAGSSLTGGAGFDTMWDTAFQHALVNNNGNPAGVVQEAANGWRTDMDNLMSAMVDHPGFQNSMNQITIISDHDEVGNAARTINVAMDGQPYTVPSQWARGEARAAFGVGMLAPGIPLYFEGEESLANNKFTWDVPTTWDLGWDWLNVGKDWNWSQVDFTDAKRQNLEEVMAGKASADALSDTDKQVLGYLQSLPADQRAQGEYNIMRKEHYLFCQDVTHLRESTPAFDGDAAVARVYTHNDNSVMAYTRSKGGDTYMVVSNFSKSDYSNYGMATPDGQWQLVLDSDDAKYGGTGIGKAAVGGGQGSQFDLPAGGVLVYKKVG